MERRQRVPATSTSAEVAAELTEMSLRGFLPTVFLGLVGMIGAAVAIAHRYRDAWMFLIAALMAGFGLPRIAIVLRVQKSESYRRRFLGSRLQQALLEVLLLFYFSTLAASTLWSFHRQRVPAEIVCTLGIFIICNGISGRIESNPRAAKLHGLLLMLVLAACLWNPRDSIAITEEIMLAMFAFVHCRAVQEKYDIVVEQIRNQRELRLLSERDPLTGLSNRRGFEAALADLCREGATFALLTIDLDRFKPVNDLHGHAIGDEVLRQVGKRLLAIVRTQDLVARLGGDEFAILQLPVTERRNAEALAARVVHAIGQPFQTGEARVTVGGSVGIALRQEAAPGTASILKRADDALYRAKQAGRGQFIYAEAAEALGPPIVYAG